MLALLWAALLGPSPALAARDFRTSVTLSPLLLTVPMAELTAELRARKRLGVAALLGVGARHGTPLYELGASGRGYLTGTFGGGMQLGGELAFVQEETPVRHVLLRRGPSAGAFVGAKHAFRFGLTAEVQGGLRVDLRGPALGPLLRAGLGWSF